MAWSSSTRKTVHRFFVVMVPWRKRQGEQEGHAVLWVGLDPELAPVGLNERTTDHQPQTHALRLGRAEGLEQVLDRIHRESRSRVGYRRLGVIARAAGPERQPAALAGARGQ